MADAVRPDALRPSTVRPVPLDSLVGGLVGGLGAEAPVAVSGVTLDSRLVQSGDLYVALPGRRHHGASFAAAAAANGAVAVLTDPAGAAAARDGRLPVAVVDDPRAQMGRIAADVYGRPADRLRTLAVTGTNGKTTTTFLLEAALRAAGVRTGLVGTVGFRLDGGALPGIRTTITTPESPELQGLLGYLVERGAEAVVMEVSSHALALGRTDPIRFDVAGFTNLGQDHLDFHGDLESYFEAKASLFTPARTQHAVLNVDDARGGQIAERVARAGVALTTVSLDMDADCRAVAHEYADGLVQVQSEIRGRTLSFQLGLPGDFNVRNALTALAMLAVLDIDLDTAAAGLRAARVPGRMERVDLGTGAPTVFVDFAHTPQAVAAALAAVRPSGRTVVVLGCGGDRDPDKRGPMGAAAARGADMVVVTDDNPRSEDAATIRRQVLSGAERVAHAERPAVQVIDGGGRRAAIALALRQASAADVVAILGKGHETGQEIGGTMLAFDDVAVVLEEWRRLASVGAHEGQSVR